MARPLTASDEDIMLAAGKVLAKRGPEAFSIKEVAQDLGLSRAAIILRFKSTHALKVASLQRMVAQFAAVMDTLPKTPSGDNVLRLSAFLGSYVHTRESSQRFFATYASNVRDRELLELERQRGVALDKAIAAVMPPCALPHESAVLAFRAHLSGSIMAWLTLDDPDSRRYVLLRTRDWLKLAAIPFDERVVEELLSPHVASGAPSAIKRARAKAAAGKRPARRAKSNISR